jgi:nitroreductase
MDAIEAILTRRSIRKYTAEPVSDAVAKDLLEAAMAAPSAGNQQPWHFVIIRDSQILVQIPSVHPYSSMVPQASLAILVCGDQRLEKHSGYWVQDCAAATQNLLLAAHARGLGAVWLGVYPREDRVAGLRKLLGLPESVTPLALISVGYPAERKPKADRYNPARVHTDGW